MKKTLATLLFILLFISCENKEAAPPTATGSYSGTFSGYVSPQSVEGVCTAEFVEEDGKLTGDILFDRASSSGQPYFFSGTIDGTTISGTLKMSGFGDFPCNGTTTADRKTIEMSINPAPVLNLKWTLTKK